MAVKAANLPSIVLERIESAFPDPAIFGVPEAEEWPVGALHSLVHCRLLQETSHATFIRCPGCEWDCSKPVIVRAARRNGSRRAFVNCDEEPDLGRIFISLERLKRYQSTLAMLADFMRRTLGIASPCWIESPKSIRLGQIKGRYGSRPAWIVLDDASLKLRVGRQKEPIASLMRWQDDSIRVDRSDVLRLANRKEPPPAPPRFRGGHEERRRRKSSRNRLILRQAQSLRKKRFSWVKISEQIAAMDFIKNDPDCGEPITPSTIRRIISAMLSD